MPVGMLDLAMFESRTTALGPGDKLVIFTDGLTEALSPTGIFFDAERVLEGVQALAGQPAGAVVSGLVAQVKRFTEGAPQADDITVLVVEMGHETHTDL
jgi:serine phosphatase RsbU (regulator of sigma subunit)